MENANTPTATPTDPHITALLAPPALVTSPLANKNIKPAITNMTTEKPANNGHIKLNTASIIVITLTFAPGGKLGIFMASTATGKKSKVNAVNVGAIFLFIIFKIF